MTTCRPHIERKGVYHLRPNSPAMWLGYRRARRAFRVEDLKREVALAQRRVNRTRFRFPKPGRKRRFGLRYAGSAAEGMRQMRLYECRRWHGKA